MILSLICLALVAIGQNATETTREIHIHGDTLVENVEHTLGVCTAIVNAVNQVRAMFYRPKDLRRLSKQKEMEDFALILGVQNKLGTCVDVVDVVDDFNRNLMAKFTTEEDSEEFVHKDPIILNVGGKLFTTSLSTLRSKNDTFFDKMFRKGANTTISADGTYFIDRDPSTFGYVLDYLRSGDLLVKSDDEHVRMQVLDDAEHYELPEELQDYLRWSSLEGIDLWFSEVDFLNEQLKQVSREMGGLLFQVSKDGDAPSTFHNRCDGKGPTVVIVETKSGNVFGGYSYTSWSSSSGSHASSTKAFLFTLRPSMKRIDQRSGYTSYAIYRHKSYGPTFGGGHDLYLKDCTSYATCSVGRHTYYGPSSYWLNDGERYFRIKDYAVVQAKAI